MVRPIPAQQQSQGFSDLFSWFFGPRVTPAPIPAAAEITPPTRTATR
jgi:hypothetical protein